MFGPTQASQARRVARDACSGRGRLGGSAAAAPPPPGAGHAREVVGRRRPVVDCRAVDAAPVPGIVFDATAHGHRAWVEQRLFEVLGGWVAVTAEAEARNALAVGCRRHEWHAGLWRDLVPDIGRATVDERLVAPSPAWVALLEAVAAAPTTVERLVGFTRVVLAHLITADDARLAVATPVADAPLRRVLSLVLADDVDEWRTGEGLLRRLVVDRATVDAAVAHQNRVEHLLLDARASARRG